MKKFTTECAPNGKKTPLLYTALRFILLWNSKIAFLSLVYLILYVNPVSAQYLHRNGKQIVDGNGDAIIIRAMGLGGWMLQEGYMLETNSFANPQHQIRAAIEELIGPANTDAFYEAWYNNHCTKADIDSLASWGFNAVRLPMHYNLFTLPIEKEPVAGQHTWLEKGFALTDSLVKWCSANSMYVILDLHAAPGGQGKDAAISDYDATKPSLWESEANKQKTIALWRKLAERYATEKWIGGYDLINETNWNFTPGQNQNGCDETANTPLRNLLVDITTAIREVDPNHLIFIEGNCWANNHNGLYPAWDANMAISFHKYWTFNDKPSIQHMLNLRDQHNLPLWMGEAGENSNVWFTSAIRLLEEHNIGWAWWPMKKVGSVVNPLTIVKNEGYNNLLNYWKNGGAKPSVTVARDALMQLAENLKIKNNRYRKDVIDAMFRQVNDASTRPFTEHTLPGVVHLADYDLGRHNKAYFDTDTATHHVTVGTYTAWNNGWTYRNDGVDIQTTSDTDASSNGYNIGWTADGEWLAYTVNVDSSAAYNVTIRYAAANAISKVKLMVNGADQSPVIDLPPTGSNQTWANKTVEDVILFKGVQKLRFMFIKGGANVSYLKFTLSKKVSETPFQSLGAETSEDGQWIYLSFNKKADAATIQAADAFTLTVNEHNTAVSELVSYPEKPALAGLRLDHNLNDRDVIRLSYAGNTIKAADGTPLQPFSDLAVTNNLPYHIWLPAKVEAENFIYNFGLQLETTTDTGGGQNIGFTNTGDYLDYRISVAAAGEYTVEFRVASAGQAGRIELQQLSKDYDVLNTITINVPVTGGWQTWKTISTTMTLDAGSSLLRLKILQPEFNVNWIRFTQPVINSVPDQRQGSLNIYPNPASKELMIEAPSDAIFYDTALTIKSLNGSTIKKFNNLNLAAAAPVYIGDLGTGVYVVELISEGRIWRNKLLIR